MIGATMCSGILAPEVAMPWVTWKWCAEIEPFPCSVIKHRRPRLLNLGNVTATDFIDRAVAQGTLDIFVAGTPCQSFSVAGLRGSLSDARGNLAFRFVELTHAIKPRFTVWENVPGVLSTNDNAFGCFLGGLVGADEAIAPAARWTRAGVVAGPLGTAAWRVLDAQYFHLAQRRERVFVVFCFGGRDNPAEILLEWESMRRDFAPSREEGQGVAPTTEGRAGRSGANNFNTSGGLIGPADVTGTLSARNKGGGGLGTDFDLAGGVVEVAGTFRAPTGGCRTELDGHGAYIPMAFGGNNTAGALDVATACNAKGGAGRFDASEDGTGRGTPLVAETLRSHPRPGSNSNGAIIPILEAGARTGASTDDPRAGIGIGAPGDPMYTLQSGKQHAVAIHGTQDPCVSDIAFAMGRNDGQENAIVFDTTQITSKANRSQPKAGDPCHPIASQAHAPAIAFSSKDHCADAGELSPTLRAGGHTGSYANSGVPPAIAFRASGQEGFTPSDITPPITSTDGGGAGVPTVGQQICSGMSVRRLTPRECARLQGFPDTWTEVPHRNKPAADGPQYKAYGNSMAVPCLAWIGNRIKSAMLASATLLALSLSGCTPALTNKEIVEQTQYCHDHGMKALALENILSRGRTHVIECEPMEQK